jgi:hypothetical protein
MSRATLCTSRGDTEETLQRQQIVRGFTSWTDDAGVPAEHVEDAVAVYSMAVALVRLDPAMAAGLHPPSTATAKAGLLHAESLKTLSVAPEQVVCGLQGLHEHWSDVLSSTA